MPAVKRSRMPALVVIAGLPMSGCFIVSDAAPAPLLGTLSVEWTIEGGRDPLDCVDLGADRLELVIFDVRGVFVDELEPFCESFGVSLELYEGRYFADATLVDSFDRAATVTEPLDALDVLAGTDLVVSVDFGLESFL